MYRIGCMNGMGRMAWGYGIAWGLLNMMDGMWWHGDKVYQSLTWAGHGHVARGLLDGMDDMGFGMA